MNKLYGLSKYCIRDLPRQKYPQFLLSRLDDGNIQIWATLTVTNNRRSPLGFATLSRRADAAYYSNSQKKSILVTDSAFRHGRFTRPYWIPYVSVTYGKPNRHLPTLFRLNEIKFAYVKLISLK